MADDTSIRARVPESLEIEVMRYLVRLGGVITNIAYDTESRTAISSTLPKSRVADFRSWLQSFSDGRGSFSEE